MARAQQKEFDPRPGAWRTFEVTTRVEILNPRGVTRVWLPVPSVKAEYQNPGENKWSGTARTMKLVDDGKYGASMLYAEFADGETTPVGGADQHACRRRADALDWSKPTPVRRAPPRSAPGRLPPS